MVTEYSKSDANQMLSENFRVGEFACKCSRCSRVLVDDVLVQRLQQLRNYFGKAVNINSGYRCEPHNAEVGGSATSHHTRGMAADIRVKGVTPREVARCAESIGIRRIGLYEGNAEGDFVHIGSGTSKRFWLGHAGVSTDTFDEVGAKKFAVELPVLKRGMKGEAVRALQAQLDGYGYNVGTSGLDGSFGSATETAVKKYQEDNGLDVDGIAGPRTRRSMLGL